MKVLAKMSTDVVSVSIDEDIATVYELMMDGDFRHVPVIDEGVVVGIISDRDILLHATGAKSSIKVPSRPVMEVMTKNPITCSPGTDIGEAASIMLEKRIDSLPVVASDGTLVGMFTSADILDMASCVEEDVNVIEAEVLEGKRPHPSTFGEGAHYSPFFEHYVASE